MFRKSAVCIAFVSLLVLGVPQVASAEVACNGVLTGTYEKVVVGNGSCVLDGATVTDSILIEKGSGTIDIRNLSGHPDLKAVDWSGNITVTDAALSDVTIEKTTGAITLERLVTDSDVKVATIQGDVALRSSAVQGDAESQEVNGQVVLQDSNFFGEDVKIEKNSGAGGRLGNST